MDEMLLIFYRKKISMFLIFEIKRVVEYLNVIIKLKYYKDNRLNLVNDMIIYFDILKLL